MQPVARGAQVLTWVAEHKARVAATLVASLFLACYLPVGLAILYNYGFWLLRSGSVRLAEPSLAASGTALRVPKLLHQTWKDANLPEKWRAAQQSCIDAHPGYEYKLWTDADALQLIMDKFPWFLDTYLSYPYPIQRADVMRYFVLYEYGGIYLDLDVACLKSLDAFRDANFTAPKTYPVGVSNDVMIAAPKDPFSYRLITNLKKWHKWFFVRYATVMFSTGPMFVTVQYTLFPGRKDVTVLPADVYGKYEPSPNAYLGHLHGSSWHGGDAKYIFWLEHYGLRSLAGAALLAVTALTALLISRRYPGAGPRLNQQLAGLWAGGGKEGGLGGWWSTAANGKGGTPAKGLMLGAWAGSTAINGKKLQEI